MKVFNYLKKMNVRRRLLLTFVAIGLLTGALLWVSVTMVKQVSANAQNLSISIQEKQHEIDQTTQFARDLDLYIKSIELATGEEGLLTKSFEQNMVNLSPEQENAVTGVESFRLKKADLLSVKHELENEHVKRVKAIDRALYNLQRLVTTSEGIALVKVKKQQKTMLEEALLQTDTSVDKISSAVENAIEQCVMVFQLQAAFLEVKNHLSYLDFQMDPAIGEATVARIYSVLSRSKDDFSVINKVIDEELVSQVEQGFTMVEPDSFLMNLYGGDRSISRPEEDFKTTKSQIIVQLNELLKGLYVAVDNIVFDQVIGAESLSKEYKRNSYENLDNMNNQLSILTDVANLSSKSYQFYLRLSSHIQKATSDSYLLIKKDNAELSTKGIEYQSILIDQHIDMMNTALSDSQFLKKKQIDRVIDKLRESTADFKKDGLFSSQIQKLASLYGEKESLHHDVIVQKDFLLAQAETLQKEVASSMDSSIQKSIEASSASEKKILVLGCSMLFILLLISILTPRFIVSQVSKGTGGIQQSVSQITEESGHIVDESNRLVEQVGVQSGNIVRIGSAIEEMSQAVSGNSENASIAFEKVEQVTAISQIANDTMEELVRSMSEMTKASDEATNVVKTIDEIAFQTNILALNAAVEAARAGESGAGFAVVADEVRNLAARSAEASSGTAELLSQIAARVENSEKIVNTTSKSFQEVVDFIEETKSLMKSVSIASNQQSAGITDIVNAVEEFKNFTTQTKENVYEFSKAGRRFQHESILINEKTQDLIDRM